MAKHKQLWWDYHCDSVSMVEIDDLNTWEAVKKRSEGYLGLRGHGGLQGSRSVLQDEYATRYGGCSTCGWAFDGAVRGSMAQHTEALCAIGQKMKALISRGWAVGEPDYVSQELDLRTLYRGASIPVMPGPMGISQVAMTHDEMVVQEIPGYWVPLEDLLVAIALRYKSPYWDVLSAYKASVWLRKASQQEGIRDTLLGALRSRNLLDDVILRNDVIISVLRIEGIIPKGELW